MKPAQKHCPNDGANSGSGTDGLLKIKEISSWEVTQGSEERGDLCKC